MVSGTTEALYSVSGSSGHYVFAAGDNGAILRYDGTGGSGMNGGVTHTLRGVWVNNDSESFAVGDNGIVLYYNGNSWSKVTNDITGDTLRAVWGSSGTWSKWATSGSMRVGSGPTDWLTLPKIWAQCGAAGTKGSLPWAVAA